MAGVTKQLAAGTTIKTLEGAAVTPGQMGGSYEVNDAHVVCGKRPDRQRHRVHHRHRADAPVLLITEPAEPGREPPPVRDKDFHPERAAACGQDSSTIGPG